MIVRSQRHQRFTVIDNRAIEDDRLSFKATGLLIYLLSKPDHWTVSEAHLADQKRDGLDSVRTALQELEQAGYLVRSRSRDERGQFVHLSTIYDNPQPAPEVARLDSPGVGFPSVDKPSGDKPSGDKPTLVSTEVVKTEKGKTEVVKTELNQHYPSPAASALPGDGPAAADPLSSLPDAAPRDISRALQRGGVRNVNPTMLDAYLEAATQHGPRLVVQAIDEAAKSGKASSFGYVLAILKRLTETPDPSQPLTQKGRTSDKRPSTPSRSPYENDAYYADLAARLERDQRSQSERFGLAPV